MFDADAKFAGKLYEKPEMRSRLLLIVVASLRVLANHSTGDRV
jgi:hypothetical protein